MLCYSSMLVYFLIVIFFFFIFFFFFSSRRRHTRCSRDWSSDVCSSDLHRQRGVGMEGAPEARERGVVSGRRQQRDAERNRSEERRVGKECRSRWAPEH